MDCTVGCGGKFLFGKLGYDGISHAGGAYGDFAGGITAQVACTVALGDNTAHSCLYGICCCGFFARVAQKHGHGEYLGNGVGNALAGNVGCRTAGGFVKPEGAFYLLVKTPTPDAYEFYERARGKEIFVVPCDDFGIDGYVRIAYCVEKSKIINSLPAFKKLAEEYKITNDKKGE